MKSDPLEVGRIRNLVLLPPYLAADVMAATSLLPSEMIVIFLAASSYMKTNLEDSDGFEVNDYDAATVHIISFYGAFITSYSHLIALASPQIPPYLTGVLLHMLFPYLSDWCPCLTPSPRSALLMRFSISYPLTQIR